MWVEKLKNGKYKYVERYKDPLTGKLKKVSVTYEKNNRQTKSLAIRELEEKIQKIESLVETNIMTFHTLCDLYLEECTNNCKESTIGTYKSHINVLKSTIQNVNLDVLTPAYIDIKAKDLARWTQLYLKSMLIWAFKKDYIDKDLGRKMFIKKPVDKNQKLYYEAEEVKEILLKLDDGISYTDKLVRLLIEFLTLTGLRIGEATALLEDDINGYQLTINKRYYRKVVSLPKSKSGIRIITLNNRGKQIISELKMLKRMYDIDSNILFASCNRVTNPYLEQQTIKDVLKRFNIDTRIHIFRHTHASILSENGIPLETIMRRLGHSDSKITRDIYIHVTNKIKSEENDMFKELEIL